MDELILVLPNSTDDVTIDVTDKSLYNYDFSSFSLVPLQQIVSLSVQEKIKKSIYTEATKTKLIEKLVSNDEIEYVAKISNKIKKKLETGELSLGVKKTSKENLAIIKDTLTGKIVSHVPLEKKVVDKLGSLPELAAMQGQLNIISDQIDSLNHIIKRVEQGQYNDRYAGFFSARQTVIEGLSIKDETLKKQLLMSAVQTSNETIGKLMVSIREDSLSLLDLKLKAKDAENIDSKLQESIGYLNSTVQLNLIAYTALEESYALLSTISNYQMFIEQTLLSTLVGGTKTVAWQIDNLHKGDNGKFNELSSNLTLKISELISSTKVIEKGGVDNGK